MLKKKALLKFWGGLLSEIQYNLSKIQKVRKDVPMGKGILTNFYKNQE